MEEDAVVHTPPDPLWPSGVCSVIIHQIVSLEYQNMEGSFGKRKGREFEPAQPAGENTSEVHKKLPSAYCTILFNDEFVSPLQIHNILIDTNSTPGLPYQIQSRQQ
jgi:hypothetical protein